jgi:hypothetical protein
MNIKEKKTLQDFILMEKLELKYYSEEHITPHKEAYEWYLAFPMTDVALEENGKIVAFMDIIPIKDDIFNKIKKGRLNDKYLTTEDMIDLAQLKAGETVNLLLSCIVVDEAYRKTNAIKIMIKEHLKNFQSYIDKGIIFDSIITSNVTKQGEKFSSGMGFSRVGSSGHNSVLYISKFDKFADQYK